MIFVCVCLAVGIAGYVFSLPIMFNKSEIVLMKNNIMKKIKK